MLFVAAVFFATVIADADRVEPCPAIDGVLLYRESGIALLRLDGIHAEEPAPRDINCAVTPRGETVLIPLQHCGSGSTPENDGFAAAEIRYDDEREHGLWLAAADGRVERLAVRPDGWALLGHGRIVVTAYCPVLDCDPEAFVYDFESHERRDLFTAVAEPTTPPGAVPAYRSGRRGARMFAIGFGSDPARRAVLISVWKFAGFSAAVTVPTERPFETDAFLVVPSVGRVRRIDRNLSALPWNATILLHDSGTILIVTGRHIERISSFLP